MISTIQLIDLMGRINAVKYVLILIKQMQYLYTDDIHLCFKLVFFLFGFF